MSRLDDLIDALNRNSDLLEAERNERARTRNDRIATAREQLCQARNNRVQARKAYRLAKVGNIAGTLLLPVGILLTAGAVVTNVSTLATFGILGAGAGAVMKYFLCSKERVKQMHDRLSRAENNYEEINDYINNI